MARQKPSKEELRKIKLAKRNEKNSQRERNTKNKEVRKVARLQGTKIIIINNRFKIRANVDFDKKQIQFSKKNVYTNILSPEDIISYELRTIQASFNEPKPVEHLKTITTLDIRTKDVMNPAFIAELDNAQAREELKVILPELFGKAKGKVTKEVNFDELIKYKELLDKHIITKAEFEKKKKQILG